MLPEILKKAAIARPLLLGQSDGASIAIIYAATFAGLILEAPHVFVEDITITSIAQARVQYKETDLSQRLGRYHADVDSLFWGWNNVGSIPVFATGTSNHSWILFAAPSLCFKELKMNMGPSSRWRRFNVGFQKRLDWLWNCGNALQTLTVNFRMADDSPAESSSTQVVGASVLRYELLDRFAWSVYDRCRDRRLHSFMAPSTHAREKGRRPSR